MQHISTTWPVLRPQLDAFSVSAACLQVDRDGTVMDADDSSGTEEGMGSDDDMEDDGPVPQDVALGGGQGAAPSQPAAIVDEEGFTMVSSRRRGRGGGKG